MQTISGTVIRGSGYGKKLGFPTANIDREDYVAQGLDIPLGIYAGTVTVRSEVTDKGLRIADWPAGIVIGPKDDIGLPKLEAHLLDFSGDLYGLRLALMPYSFLRPYRSFPTEAQLKKQIETDLQSVRTLFEMGRA